MNKGMTLIEMLVSLTITAIIMTTIVFEISILKNDLQTIKYTINDEKLKIFKLFSSYQLSSKKEINQVEMGWEIYIDGIKKITYYDNSLYVDESLYLKLTNLDLKNYKIQNSTIIFFTNQDNNQKNLILRWVV